MRKPPADPKLKQFAIDWDVVADGWHPRIILPLNLPDFPPALHLREEAVDVRLYRVLHADPTRWILNDGVDTVEVMGPPV